MRQRLFLNANVLFTIAHNPQGKAALVMEIGQAGLWQLVSSAYSVEEARRNIGRKTPDALERLDALNSTLHPASAGVGAGPHGLPEKDVPIYRAALACKADVLLTGDLRDFGFLMNDREKAGGLMIKTVAEFLAAC